MTCVIQWVSSYPICPSPSPFSCVRQASCSDRSFVILCVLYFLFLEVCPYVSCTINLVLVSPSKTDTCILLSHFSSVWLFAILWTGAHQTALSMVFTRQEYWNWKPCSSPGDLPDPVIETVSLMSPVLASEFFTTSIMWEAPKTDTM